MSALLYLRPYMHSRPPGERTGSLPVGRNILCRPVQGRIRRPFEIGAARRATAAESESKKGKRGEGRGPPAGITIIPQIILTTTPQQPKIKAANIGSACTTHKSEKIAFDPTFGSHSLL